MSLFKISAALARKKYFPTICLTLYVTLFWWFPRGPLLWRAYHLYQWWIGRIQSHCLVISCATALVTSYLSVGHGLHIVRVCFVALLCIYLNGSHLPFTWTTYEVGIIFKVFKIEIWVFHYRDIGRILSALQTLRMLCLILHESAYQVYILVSMDLNVAWSSMSFSLSTNPGI